MLLKNEVFFKYVAIGFFFKSKSTHNVIYCVKVIMWIQVFTERYNYLQFSYESSSTKMIMEDRLNKNYGCLITILRAPDNFLAQSSNSLIFKSIS